MKFVVSGSKWMGSGIGSIRTEVSNLLEQSKFEVMVFTYSISLGAENFFSGIEDCLKRDVTVAGNRRTSTWAAWVKIGWNTFTNDSSTIEPKYTLFCCGNSDGRWNVGIANVTTNSGHPVLTVSNRDSGGGQAFEVGTSQVFRDPSSW